MSSGSSIVHARQILHLLKKHYHNATIALNYSNNWELLVAVILSAQCTDKQVNKVTKRLFTKYTSIEDYAKVPRKELEQDIRSTGYYRNKAKNIQNAATMVLTNYGGTIPETMEEILNLPGVARKTANVVLGNAYGIVEGIAVDTHVKRLSNRLGFTKSSNPEKIEKDLMKLFLKKEWFSLTYYLIEHGRAVCHARKPRCNACILQKHCPSAFEFSHFK